MLLYIDTKVKIIPPERFTLEFLTNLRILQSDVLAPLIPGLHQKTGNRARSGQRDGIKVSTDFIADLDLTDDLATVTGRFTENNRLCPAPSISFSDIAGRYGLLINIDKTEYMSYKIPIPKPVNSDERVFVNGTPDLEEVDDFNYLGSHGAPTSRDINAREGLACKALQSINAFWEFDMSRKINNKIFRTAVETWILGLLRRLTLEH